MSMHVHVHEHDSLTISKPILLTFTFNPQLYPPFGLYPMYRILCMTPSPGIL